jgi:ferredoxin-NADP reductase
VTSTPIVLTVLLVAVTTADAGYYRITVKREHNGAASCYLHTRIAVGDQLEIAAPRGTFVLDRTHAPVLLISAGIGATPDLAMLHTLAEEHSDREIWWVHCAGRSREHSFAAEIRTLLASLPNVHSRVYYSRPDPNDLEGRDFDSTGHLTASALAELEPPRDAVPSVRHLRRRPVRSAADTASEPPSSSTASRSTSRR